MKPLCVASIPASGTWFTYYMLPGRNACLDIIPGHKYLTHFDDPGHQRFLDECFVIIPVRSREAVEKSWNKRGWDIRKLDALWTYMESVTGFHLQIDSPDRDARLAVLSHLIGTSLTTDWAPANRDLG